MELNAEAKEELRELLREEPSFIGEVYRSQELGADLNELVKTYGHKNSGNITIFLNAIALLFSLESFRNTTLASSKKQALYRVKAWLTKDLSEELRRHLEALLESSHEAAVPLKTKLSTASSSPQPPQKVDGVPVAGVYVYSFPNYLESGERSLDGRALLKVGASLAGVEQRLAYQARKTEVPEDLVLLRVYRATDPFAAERRFHGILAAAGHHHESREGGVEWFRTSLKLLDEIAAALGLENQYDG